MVPYGGLFRLLLRLEEGIFQGGLRALPTPGFLREDR
jgi:hypothetical protein